MTNSIDASEADLKVQQKKLAQFKLTLQDLEHKRDVLQSASKAPEAAAPAKPVGSATKGVEGHNPQPNAKPE